MLKGWMVCGCIHQNLKLGPQVHLAALGCERPHGLLTEVWDCDYFEVFASVRPTFRCPREQWQAVKRKCWIFFG